jgi:magnesium transporter
MLRTLYRHRSGTILLNLPVDQLAAAAKESQARLWIDLTTPTREESLLVLETIYHFHPLAVEDAVKDVHVPKLDDYGSYLYLVFHTVGLGDTHMDIHTDELDVFLGANFLITMHDSARPVIDEFWDEEHHRKAGLARGPAFLLYELLDQQTDTYIPMLDQFEEQLETLGNQIFHRPPKNSDHLLNDLLTAKSSALRLYRVLAPQRDLLQRLARTDYAPVPADARIYFNDVLDHLVRLVDLSSSMRDLSSSTIDAYQTLVNNRMNEVMKVLTMISTIFIPLSFIAGVYGMNLRMPEQTWRWSYPLVWMLFIGIALGMLWFFRRREWI